MKSYVCKVCGYAWQSANPALECARFGCGSRLVAEVSRDGSVSGLGGGGGRYNGSPLGSVRPSGTAPTGDGGFKVFNVGAVVFLALGLLAVLGSRPGEVEMGIVGLAMILYCVAFVLLLVKMHGAWQGVQAAAGLGRGLKIPSPGKAVGYLFIPVFNLYWMFIAFKGLMDAANALKEDRRIPGPSFCSDLAMGYALIVTACTVFGAGLGGQELVGMAFALVTCLVSCILWFPIMRDVVRIVNTFR